VASEGADIFIITFDRWGGKQQQFMFAKELNDRHVFAKELNDRHVFVLCASPLCLLFLCLLFQLGSCVENFPSRFTATAHKIEQKKPDSTWIRMVGHFVTVIFDSEIVNSMFFLS
jgi:hypothetical protein